MGRNVTAASADEATRQRALQAKVAEYVRAGWVIESQGALTVQLRRPKRFRLLLWLFWTVVTLGAGLVLYPLYHHVVKREPRVILTAGDAGITTTRA